MKFKTSSLALAVILAMLTVSEGAMAATDCIVNGVQFVPKTNQLVLDTSAGGPFSGGCAPYPLTFTDNAKLELVVAIALAAQVTGAHIDFNAGTAGQALTLQDISINQVP